MGAMGHRIAGRLLKSGFRVTVFDWNPAEANALIAYGAIMARTIAELASETDVILSCLANVIPSGERPYPIHGFIFVPEAGDRFLQSSQ
jgi:6-phosphogluconate dehydrogenase (decarboxylating)